MKKTIKEFKEFISRGNILDLAVGVIIGTSFTAIVTSLVNDMIMPVVNIFTTNNFDKWVIPLKGDITLKIGDFIGSIISFLIISIVVFTLVKIMSKIEIKSEVVKEDKQECPFCKTKIHKMAVKCPHCTSDLKTEKGKRK